MKKYLTQVIEYESCSHKYFKIIFLAHLKFIQNFFNKLIQVSCIMLLTNYPNLHSINLDVQFYNTPSFRKSMNASDFTII